MSSAGGERLCEGRVCVVTGAGRGIGREHALMLAEHGAAVVVNDLGAAVDGRGADTGPAEAVVDEIEARGGAAVANTDDVSTLPGAQRLVDQAVEAFGGLDVVVNNAGILRDRMLVNMSEEEWDAVIRVHLRGTFAPSRVAAAYWRDRSKAGERNDARIVNTTSASGIWGNVGQVNYGTVIAARELGRYGVTVNAIAPGALTRMTENLGFDEARGARLDPHWIAPVCTWLASTRSAGVTECVFVASGERLALAEGWHLGPSAAPVADPAEVDAVARRLLAEARPHATMADPA